MRAAKPVPRSREILAWLKSQADPKWAKGLSRFGVVTASKILGISVDTLRKKAAESSKSLEVADELFTSGIYEAEIMACLLAPPKELTAPFMMKWIRRFDNWAVTDSACFGVFDRASAAASMIPKLARAKPEFEKRAAFALIAGIAVHDKAVADEALVAYFPIIEGGANDPRNFVKKAVSWALRNLGKRSLALWKPAIETALRLAGSDNPVERWVGKDALRDLQRATVTARLRKKAATAKRGAS